MAEENKQNNATLPTKEEIFSSLGGFGDIKLELKVLLGKVHMPIGNYLKISRGSMIELGRKHTDTLDIIVNNTKVAEGEVVMSDSDKIGVEVVKVHKPKKF